MSLSRAQRRAVANRALRKAPILSVDDPDANVAIVLADATAVVLATELADAALREMGAPAALLERITRERASNVGKLPVIVIVDSHAALKWSGVTTMSKGGSA